MCCHYVTRHCKYKTKHLHIYMSNIYQNGKYLMNQIVRIVAGAPQQTPSDQLYDGFDALRPEQNGQHFSNGILNAFG